MALDPQPCDAGSGASGPDVEQTLLCDVLPDGTIAGSALAVYEYDETGSPVGPPTFVDPVTGLPYVAQGVLQPCGNNTRTVEILCDVQPDGTSVPFERIKTIGPAGTVIDVNDATLAGAPYTPTGTVEVCGGNTQSVEVLCDVQADASVVTFERVKTISPAGTIIDVNDATLDGAPYTPTGTVGRCEPSALCTPDSSVDLNGECTGGEVANLTIVAATDAQVEDAPEADELCGGGTWDVNAEPYPSPFPINEPLRTDTTNDPNVTLYGAATLTGDGVIDPPGDGWLRLTEATSGQPFGGIIFNTPFPSNESVTVEFTYADYGSGADGFSVFLLDGTQPVPVAMGGAGGGLGYASTNFGAQPGIADGIIGVGIHEWDSYATGAVVGTGGPGGQFDSVTVRGRGDLGVWNDGSYPWVTSASVAPKTIDGHTRLNPVRAKVTLLTEGASVYVTTELDFNDGDGPTTYINRFPVTAQVAPIPAQYRIGLGASTGAFANTHEIRDMQITPAGKQRWRAFTLGADEPPACATQLQVTVSVDVTFTSDSQTDPGGNVDPEAYLRLANVVTNTVVDADTVSSRPTSVGDPTTLTVTALITPAQLADLRAYVGAEQRDQDGNYASNWENFNVEVTAIGCPSTSVRTVPISAPCPLPVRIVGGSGGSGGGGGNTIVNTPATFEDEPVCAVILGVATTVFRREIRNPDGTTSITFLGANGATVAPESWTPGPCAEAPTSTAEFIFCDDNGPFIRKLIQNAAGAVTSVVNLTLAGAPYVPVGTVQVCPAEAPATFEDEPVCGIVNGVPTAMFRREVRTPDGTSTVTFLGADGATVVPTTWTPGPCAPVDRESFCYTLTSTGTQIHTGWARHDDTLPNTPLTANGIAFFTADGTLIDPTADGFTQVPCICPCTDDSGDTEVLQLCDDGTDPVTPFLRRLTFDATGAVTATADTTYSGAPYVVTGQAVPCGCGTASSIGTVCYTPPIPAQTLQDDWTGATSALGGGSRVWTNSNFAGQGITVTETVTPDTGATLFNGNAVRNSAVGPATQNTAIDLGDARTNVIVRMDFVGTNQGERLRNITPAFTAVTGNGTAVLGNTGVDGGPGPDGTIFLEFAGPVQNISWDWSPTGNGDSTQPQITFATELTAVTGRAAVLRDCATGETTYVDLTSGTVLDPLVISIVDCPGAVCDCPPTAQEIADAIGALPNLPPPPPVTLTAQARVLTNATPWTPTDVAGTLTGLSFTVLTGTATLVDQNATASAGIPAGATLNWQAEDRNTLSPPTSMTPDPGGSVLAVWTQR